MLAKRIIPCLDIDKDTVIKGTKFKDIKKINDPVTLAKRYSDQGADELVLYDITATSDGRDIFLKTIEAVSKVINIPLTVGGGIRTVEDFSKVLNAGADKVSINSGAVRNPNLIAEAAKVYGSQCVVLSMDVMKEKDDWSVYINGGRLKTDLKAIQWAILGVSLGAGEIVLNSIDSDGVKGGYDLELIQCVQSQVNVPVIASGGAGTMDDFKAAFEVANADGALAASVFHYDEITIEELKAYLKSNGIQIRI